MLSVANKMETRILRVLLLSFGIFLSLSHPAFVFAAKITDVRIWAAPDHTRVVLDLTEPVLYESSSQEDLLQFRLELKEASLHTSKREIKANDPFLKEIILTDLGQGKVKVVLQQRKILNASVFSLKPYLDKPHRLVIDLVDVAEEKKEQEERKKQKEIRPKGTKIIVIDPGHGGEDPGAIGPQRTMEKEVVLKIGEKVAHLSNQSKEFKAFLTRKGDYFIPLEARTRMAREYGADLLISLHADASFNPRARGSSIYCLSLSGASDEAAKILAHKENMSNILGGASLRPVSLSKDPNLNQILLDLLQNNSMKESLRFAEYFLEEIRAVNPLKYPSYRQANFIVLKAPDIPSVLVETAFISNKEDERLLSKNEFQEGIAKAILSSVKRYFRP